MIITLTSKNNEKTFSDKEIINIGSNPSCDFVVDMGTDLVLTLQCDSQNNKCVLLNTFNNQDRLFKGKPLAQRIEIEKVCKLMSGVNEEFISIKIAEQQNYEVNPLEQKKAEIEKKDKKQIEEPKKVEMPMNVEPKKPVDPVKPLDEEAINAKKEAEKIAANQDKVNSFVYKVKQCVEAYNSPDNSNLDTYLAEAEELRAKIDQIESELTERQYQDYQGAKKQLLKLYQK